MKQMKIKINGKETTANVPDSLLEETYPKNFLIKQNKELKKMAEQAGSEMATWKHKFLRAEERIKQLKFELSMLKNEVK